MPQEIDKYCGACGSLRNDLESKFCGECGANFSDQSILTAKPSTQTEVIETSRSVELDKPPSQNTASNNYFSNAGIGLAALGVSLSGFFAFGAIVIALVSKSRREKNPNFALGFAILSIAISLLFGSLYSPGSVSEIDLAPTPKTEAYIKGFVIGQNFTKVSLAQTSADQACSTARDKNIVFVSGVPQFINDRGKVQSILREPDGFAGCIDGFKDPYASPPAA